ncbi:hypothetical protein ACSNOI_30095 [Actinomadura kijaniata]|uniref:hypothetical protein n=1 Tax=Actinomadura kijaniata TaxID=46161 RepID=UPI003F1C3CE0
MISATGTRWQPHLPHYPGRDLHRGRQLHTADYHGPQEFHGRRVVVVGGRSPDGLDDVASAPAAARRGGRTRAVRDRLPLPRGAAGGP